MNTVTICKCPMDNALDASYISLNIFNSIKNKANKADI